MYPGRLFTIGNVITRINKTLSVVEQIIPLYVKAKPLVNNAKDAIKVARKLLKNTNDTKDSTTNNKVIDVKVNSVKNTNKPVFFR